MRYMREFFYNGFMGKYLQKHSQYKNCAGNYYKNRIFA